MSVPTYKATCGVVASPDGEYVNRTDYIAQKERADRAEAQLAALQSPPRSPGDEPVITHDEAQCALKIMTIIADNMNRTPCEEEAIRELLHDSSLGEAVALEVNACATYQRWRAGDVAFARDHEGLKCSAKGLLGRCARIVDQSPDGHAAGYGFMLRDQLLKHLVELARRYYAGEVAVVDEFLQLYCLGEEERKLALSRRAPDSDVGGRADAIAAALSDFVEQFSPPAADCSCHLSAPCPDCVKHGATRELITNGQAALAAFKKGGNQ